MHEDLKNCKNLDELLLTLTCEEANEYAPNSCDYNNESDFIDALKNWNHNNNYVDSIYKYADDMCDLPNFGGTEPDDTMGIWSWDKDRLLVGTNCSKVFEIVNRADYLN